MMGYHDLSAAGGGLRVSTQDRATREGGEGEHASEHQGGDAVAGADVAGSQTTRMRAMQRRWIHRKASRAGGGGAAAASIPGGAGAQLGGETKSRMERTIGADLSGVRVHTGGESADAADELGARAFTVGSDVHFNRGEFAPGSKEGDRLLAHELTHVVQGQKSGVQRKADPAHGDAEGGEHGDHEAGGHEVSEPGDPAEHEADAMGDHAADELHGGGDKKEGEHGGGKKASPEKPKVGAAAPSVGRKIFRSDKKGSPPPKNQADPAGGKQKTDKKTPTKAPAQSAGNQTAKPPDAKELFAEKQATDIGERLAPDPGTGLLLQLDLSEPIIKKLGDTYPENQKIKAVAKIHSDKLEATKAKAVAVFQDLAKRMKALPVTGASYDQLKALRADAEAQKFLGSRFCRDLPEAKAHGETFLAQDKLLTTGHKEACKHAESMIASAPLDDTGLVQIDHAINALEVSWEGKLTGNATAAANEQVVRAAGTAQRDKITAEMKKQQEQQHAQHGPAAGAGDAPAGPGAKPAAGPNNAAAPPTASGNAGAPPAAATAAATNASKHQPPPASAQAGTPQPASNSNKPPAPVTTPPAQAGAGKPAAAGAPTPAATTPAPTATPMPVPAAAATEAQNHSAKNDGAADSATPASTAAPPTAQPTSTAAPVQAAQPQAQAPQNQGAAPVQQQAKAGAPAAPGAQAQPPKTPEELALELAEKEVDVLAQQFVLNLSGTSTVAAVGSAILSAFAHFHGGFAVALARQVGTILMKVAAESIKLQSVELIKQMDPGTIDQLLKDLGPHGKVDSLIEAQGRIQTLHVDAEKAKARAAGEDEDVRAEQEFAKMEDGEQKQLPAASKHVGKHTVRSPAEMFEGGVDLLEILEGLGPEAIKAILESLPSLIGTTLIPGLGALLAGKVTYNEKQKLKKKLEERDEAKRLHEAAVAKAAAASAGGGSV